MRRRRGTAPKPGQQRLRANVGAATPEVVADHAGVIGDLLECERTLTDALERTRARLDVELIAAQASRAPSKELAHALQLRDGGAPTADELERVARLIRQRTTIAHRRAAKGAGNDSIVEVPRHNHDGPRNKHDEAPDMERGYIKSRKVIEETYYSPGEMPIEGVSPEEELDGVEDDESEDHDFDDGEDE